MTCVTLIFILFTLPYTIRKRQTECEDYSENRAQHRGGREGKTQLNYKEHEEHVREKYSAQESKHAF